MCYSQSAHPFGFIRQLVSYASPVLLPYPHLRPAMGSEQPATQTQVTGRPVSNLGRTWKVRTLK